MKTKKTIVCGFLAVVFALLFAACSGGGGQRLTGTDSFKFTVINGGTAYSVSKGTATEGTVNIPAYYRPNADSKYLPVTEIGDWAFSRCTNLTSITIPASVTSIGYGAFSECTNLTSITIPVGVTTMGGWVFAYWTPSQTIYIKGYANEADADKAWEGFWQVEKRDGPIGWDESVFKKIDAKIVYQGK